MALTGYRPIPSASIGGGRDFGTHVGLCYDDAENKGDAAQWNTYASTNLQRIVAPEPEPLPWPEKVPFETRVTRQVRSAWPMTVLPGHLKRVEPIVCPSQHPQVETFAQTYGHAYVPDWLARPLVHGALTPGPGPGREAAGRLGSLVAACTVDSDAAPVAIVRACVRTPGRVVMHTVDGDGRPRGAEDLDVVGASVEGLVVSDRREPGQHRLVGVRAASTVAVYSVAQAAVTHRLDRMTLANPAADMALSRWFAEAVVVTTRGAVVSWSAGAQGTAAIRLVRDLGGEVRRFMAPWAPGQLVK
jgi:hypothetical protein